MFRFLQLLCLIQIVHSWSTPSTFPSALTGSISSSRKPKCLKNRLFYLPNEKEQDKEETQSFFIRESLMVDMGKASEILADGFFKDNTNFLTYQLERLQTHLSLESGFPQPSTRHQIFVACEVSTGQVIGIAEVDARVHGDDARGTNGPYMCNIAVDGTYQRMGIASALVKQCEEQVREWVCNNSNSENILSCSLYLKVRQSNNAAVSMYDKLGYRSIGQETEEKTKSVVLIMRKQLSKPEETSTTSSTTLEQSSSIIL